MKDFLKRDGSKSVLATIISILVGLIAGSLLILIVGLTRSEIGGQGIWNGIRIIFSGLFVTGSNGVGGLSYGFNSEMIGDTLFKAMSLILCGLSISLAYKTGLFNIGASGQYQASIFVTLAVALSIPTSIVPAWVVWIAALLAGMLAGALWAAVPGLLKAAANVNEVLSGIMMNWISVNVTSWLFAVTSFRNVVDGNKEGYTLKTTHNGVATAKLGLDKLLPASQVNAGILVAILIAILVFVLMSKTTLGYELKACGANRHAARYAGIKDKRNIVLSMMFAGALAGAAASLYFLSGNPEQAWDSYQKLPADGFNGIAVAMLASLNPIACIFTGTFMAAIKQHGVQLSRLTAYNEYITDVIIAVIVYLSAFSLLIKTWIGGGRKKAKAITQEPAQPIPTPESIPDATPTIQPEPDIPSDEGKEAAE